MVGVRIGWITALIGAVLVITGTFLPWATYRGGPTTVPGYMQVVGLAIIIFGVLGLLFVFLGRAGSLLTMIFGLLVVISLGVGRLFPTLLISQQSEVYVLYGIYVSLVGGIVMILGGWIARTEPRRAAKAPVADQS